MDKKLQIRKPGTLMTRKGGIDTKRQKSTKRTTEENKELILNDYQEDQGEEYFDETYYDEDEALVNLEDYKEIDRALLELNNEN